MGVSERKPRLLACDNCGHHGLHGDDYPMAASLCPSCEAGTMFWWMLEPGRGAVAAEPDFGGDNSGHDTDCDCKACLIDTWYADVEELRGEISRLTAERGAVPADAHSRAVSALFAFAQERWGWGSDEHADVADAAEVVIEALDHPRGAVEAEGERWQDVPLTDPRVEAVVDALVLHSKGLEDSPQTWRAAQIAVWTLVGPSEVEKLRGICERAIEALRYEAHPVCDEWDDYVRNGSSAR